METPPIPIFAFFESLSPVSQAFLAGTSTRSLTALGAATVFFKSQFSLRSSDFMMGFAAGVMIAASFWSLLAPAIEILQHREATPWLGAANPYQRFYESEFLRTLIIKKQRLTCTRSAIKLGETNPRPELRATTPL